LLGATLAACSSVHEGLGTSDEPCFTALPTAAHAVGSHGHLNGVRLFKVSAIPYKRLASLIRADTSSTEVCLVAYSGHFSSDQLTMSSGPSAGRFAVVVLTYPKEHLVVTALFRRVPVRFAHTHLG
jgi:hypothetical protein